MIFMKEKGHLPNFIIIGAQKCATSSLYYYLSLHPEIMVSRQKELNYFNEELCWDRGIDWYRSHFTGTAAIYGEASPHYTNYPLYKGVAEKMHRVIPQAKLIYLVRNPLERLISQYLDRVKGGQEQRLIAEALANFSDSMYIWFSQYYMQLEQYLPYYPRESFLILTAEKLKTERRATLRKVFDFLGVDNTFTSEAFEELKNVSDCKLKRKKARRLIRYLANGPQESSVIGRQLYRFIPAAVKRRALQSTLKGEPVARPVLSKELRENIIDYLYEDIEKLKRFTGYDFKEWGIDDCTSRCSRTVMC